MTHYCQSMARLYVGQSLTFVCFKYILKMYEYANEGASHSLVD